MNEDVAHARDLLPFDLGSLVEQGGIDVLDRFANLHETGTADVLDNALVQITAGEILTHCSTEVVNEHRSIALGPYSQDRR